MAAVAGAASVWGIRNEVACHVPDMCLPECQSPVAAVADASGSFRA